MWTKYEIEARERHTERCAQNVGKAEKGYVPYHIAEALRLAFYEVPSAYQYDHKKRLLPNGYDRLNNPLLKIDHNMGTVGMEKWEKYKDGLPRITAPHQNDVIEWFEKKEGVVIWVQPEEAGWKWHANNLGGEQIYSSREDALNACFERLLLV